MRTRAVLYGLRLLRILAVVGRFGRGLTANSGDQRLAVGGARASGSPGPAWDQWEARGAL